MISAERTPKGTPIGGIPPWSASSEEVARFISQHGRPYDSEKDDYVDPGPFAKPVKAGKNSPIYNAHSYHTKVPPEGIVQYLEHYTRPGDLVLDPFCGSGMTGVACIMTGRYAILNDLSPAATHIAYNYCTPVDLEALKRDWTRIKEAVKDEFDWLYGTTCDRCGRPAAIQHTVWSDVFACKACGNEIILWDTAVVRELTAEGYNPPLSSAARPGENWRPATSESAPPKKGVNGQQEPRGKGDVMDIFPCPSCGKPWRKTQLKRLGSRPVLTDYRCPEHGRRQHPTTQAELDRIAEINVAEIPYWYPTVPFESSREMWRGIHRDAGITRVCDFWTRRNLRALARLWQEAGQADERTATCLRFGVTSIFGRSSKTTRYLFRKAGNSAITGTLYVGSFVTENNLLALAERKMQDVLPGLEGVAATGHAAAIVTQHAGQDMPLRADSVDYIFTDPPFGANIFYADVNLLWEAWLGYLTDDTYEAVWNQSRKPQEGGKTLEDYARLMAGAFAEMNRVLKPGRWASVVFHNSDDRVWDAIREGAVQAGFTIESVAGFDKQQKSFKGIRGEKGLERVSNLDIVLNLRKPRLAGPAAQHNRGAAGAQETQRDAASPTAAKGNGGAVEAIVGCVEEYLRQVARDEAGQHAKAMGGQDPRGSQGVHSNVCQMVIRQGLPSVSLAQVIQVLNEYCKQVDGRWYLPGEQVKSDPWDAVLGPKDEASTIEWVRREITSKGPQLDGDLIDRFRMAAPNLKLPKDFRRMLEENFTYDKRRGRWRMPTPAESETKFSIKVRLLEGRVDSILSGEGPSPGAEGLGQLLEDCYHEGLFQQAHDIWTRITSGDLPPERYKILTRMARVARLRAGSER